MAGFSLRLAASRPHALKRTLIFRLSIFPVCVLHFALMTTTQPITTSVAENLQRVREQIAEAATRAGRRPSDVTLVAVTKTFPIETVLAAYAAGQRHFGENRVQEAADKIPSVLARAPQAHWHLIGHLQ